MSRASWPLFAKAEWRTAVNIERGLVARFQFHGVVTVKPLQVPVKDTGSDLVVDDKCPHLLLRRHWAGVKPVEKKLRSRYIV